MPMVGRLTIGRTSSGSWEPSTCRARASPVAANLQRFSGKPWAATTQITLRQGSQRILPERRGSRRPSSQSLLDIRVSKAITYARTGRIEVLLDILNVLNDTAEEGVATDNLFSSKFGQPTLFVDPRRAMLGVRLNVGR